MRRRSREVDSLAEANRCWTFLALWLDLRMQHFIIDYRFGYQRIHGFTFWCATSMVLREIHYGMRLFDVAGSELGRADHQGRLD